MSNALKRNSRHIKAAMRRFIDADDPQALEAVVRLITKRKIIQKEMTDETTNSTTT